MPSTHFSAKRRAALVSSSIESSRFRAISGTKTFSSKWPWSPPTVIAASFPITCAATCVTTSGRTGFTFPGMIELAFWSSGRRGLDGAVGRGRGHDGGGRSRHGEAGGLAEAHAHALGEVRMRVHPGADAGA